MLARLDVVGDALDVLEGPVVPPDLASFLRHAPVGCDVSLRDRYDISINVLHKSSIGRDFSRLTNTSKTKAYPPAIAPMIMKGSAPVAIASGSEASGGSCDRSSAQAKKRTKARRFCVAWSRIVPRSIG